MNHLSDSILLFFQNINFPYFDTIFYYLTKIIEPQFFIVIIYLLYLKNKEIGKNIAISFFMSGLFVQFFKILFKIPRPFIRNKEISPYNKAISSATGYSFPSGHTQAVSSIFFMINHYKKNILFILLIILISLSRIVLRVHNVYDVIFSIFISYIIYRIIIKIKNKSYIIYFIAILSIIFLIYSFFSSALLKEKMDIIKMTGAALGFSISSILDDKFYTLPIDNLKNRKQIISAIILFLIFISILIVLKNYIFHNKIYLKSLEYMIITISLFYIIPFLINKVK